jgi:hypothetical protein
VVFPRSFITVIKLCKYNVSIHLWNFCFKYLMYNLIFSKIRTLYLPSLKEETRSNLYKAFSMGVGEINMTIVSKDHYWRKWPCKLKLDCIKPNLVWSLIFLNHLDPANAKPFIYQLPCCICVMNRLNHPSLPGGGVGDGGI